MKLMGILPSGPLVLICNATSMYTNIHTDHAIPVIKDWLDSLQDRLAPNFPLNAVKEAMLLVMQNNIFQWGDMYFLYLSGTVMGLSAACMWATIYYVVHEATTLIPTYSSNRLLFKCFIDFFFGTWVPSPEQPNASINFQANVNHLEILKWTFVEPCRLVNFLDLIVSIEDNWIVMKMYQK